MLTGEVPFRGETQVAVAMKHVREQIPDVQRKRPEVSAALAAVLETATAKRLDERYADDAELIADLEDVLAIETARSGSATGEVTTVLRTLPRRTRRRVPLRLRQPIVAGALVLAVIVLVGGGILYLADRAHHGTGSPPQPAAAKRTPPAHGISLCQSCAHDYNPDALSGPKNQHPNQVGLAIDNNPNTAWSTETYDNDVLGKPGVGIYVDANPGVDARADDPATPTPPATRSRSTAPRSSPTPMPSGPPGSSWPACRASAPPSTSRWLPTASRTATTWCGSPA